MKNVVELGKPLIVEIDGNKFTMTPAAIVDGVPSAFHVPDFVLPLAAGMTIGLLLAMFLLWGRRRERP